MTNEEAIERIRKLMISSVQSSVGAEIRPIAYAFEKAIAALEKQIPKKVIEVRTDSCGIIARICPKCKGDFFGDNEDKYCLNCGQALDWEVT